MELSYIWPYGTTTSLYFFIFFGNDTLWQKELVQERKQISADANSPHLLTWLLVQHMSDVYVRPLSLLWMVALSMKILGIIIDTVNCENDFDKRMLWKRILKDSNTSACQLSVACAVRGIIHTHRPSEWSKGSKSAPQQLNKHVSAPGVDELNCSMRCKNWKKCPKISVIDGKLWSATASLTLDQLSVSERNIAKKGFWNFVVN